MFRRLQWRIALIYAALILLATFGSTIFISTQVRQVRLADLESQLLSKARLLASSATPLLRDGSTPRALDEMARLWASAISGRVTIIGIDGATLGESHEDRTEMENHLLRPEVQQALKAGQGSSIRYSTTLGYDMMYAAVPTRTGGGQLLGIIRVALPMQEIENQLSDLRQTVILIGLMAALLAAFLALQLAERIAQPVRQLSTFTEKMEKGDLSTVPVLSRQDETGQLIQSIARMVAQIHGQISSLESVLDHMTDGVVITEKDGKISLMNARAARLLSINQGEALGQIFTEVVSIKQLKDIWNECRETEHQQATRTDLTPYGFVLQVVVIPLARKEEKRCLVILQDLTQARRLEMSRSELIGNISQELRMPLTVLKAAVETLRSGGNSQLSQKEIVGHLDAEVGALYHIANELQEISRFESGNELLTLTPISVEAVVLPPVERMQSQANAAGVRLNLTLPPDLPQIMADVDRVRLALSNLLHNAIKYTPPGGTIHLDVQPAGKEILFSVQDSGVGISAEDLPRIFEQSFHTDATQSEGIGMGLAVAKQIVKVHGGRIWAESVEGQGSTFSFTLPVGSLEANLNSEHLRTI